ncbi:sodium:proton antiporter [Halobacteriales archaeon QS_4_70_19]|jgi:multicomponent Na+:H+ antiporter subunit B|nr:MAG: sodium:proton antiporter [Halobacteriales archaeon QS_4_70_19]
MSDREPTVIAKTVTRMVVPIIAVTAVALLVQGHNLPGGGFIAGVLTATAFVLLYVIYGLDTVRRTLVLRSEGYGFLSGPTESYARAFAGGLAIAVTAGIAAVAFGVPFLTQGVVFVEDIPLYGELEYASALAFDLGVYFVVVGSLLTIIAVVGKE